MADSRTLILHQYAASPFSEIVRLALAVKGLDYERVEAPAIMPKPHLTALTGGYRRIPVLQIGADVYCDTALILSELDRRHALAPLARPGHEGIAEMVGEWAGKTWFALSAQIMFDAAGDRLPEAFLKDREAMTGRPLALDAVRAAAPSARGQWRAQLMRIEARLRGAEAAGAGDYLLSSKPGLADVWAYLNPWFVQQTDAAFVENCLEDAPLTQAWMKRLAAQGSRAGDTLSAEAANAIARDASPRLLAAAAPGFEPQGLEPGAPVRVRAADYGREPVEGELVRADHERVCLSVSSDALGTVHVHFPRAGFHIEEL